MLNLKAPKDMTAPELVADVKRRIESGALKQPFDYNDLYGILSEPASNPFTPDQLAVLRELQRSGMSYAAMDASGTVFCYDTKPVMDEDGYWYEKSAAGEYIASDYLSCFVFMKEALSGEDNPIIRFADYAPLEADHV